MQEHVQLTVKNLSTTRWECRIDSVKALRYQMPQFVQALEALIKHAVAKNDAETGSTSLGILKEMQTWSFLLCVIIWYNILYQINHVSKLLQSPRVSIETLKRETDGIREGLQEYRDTGLNSAKTDAREIAEALQIEMKRKTTRRCLYEGQEETQSTPEERFNREFFLPLVDTAHSSVSERFTQMESFFALYEFLYSLDNMEKSSAGRNTEPQLQEHGATNRRC